jgi:excisionase family DNA binding protein
MLAARQVQLAEEGAQALRAQGQEEHAQAIEAVLGVALTAQPRASTDKPPEYFTPAQAARALQLRVKTVKDWIAAGELETISVDGRTVISREALLAYLDRLRADNSEPPPLTQAEIAAVKHQYEYIVKGLPKDKLARLETLHEKMEDGERMNRAERSEMIALERELTRASSQRLADWIEQTQSAGK